MTYEEALNFNQKWTSKQAFNDLERYLLRDEKPAYKAVALGMQALKKQIPIKPIGKHTDFKCAVCGRRVKSGLGSSRRQRDNFCQRCGQALDWSDYKR